MTYIRIQACQADDGQDTAAGYPLIYWPTMEDATAHYAYNNHHYNEEHVNQQGQLHHDTKEYDGHSNHIQLPSYASSPTSPSPTTPQTPFSPRAMAIQQLKRAASLREQQKGNMTPSHSQDGLNGTASSSTSCHSGHGHIPTSPINSPSTTGMSPSMSRAPSIKRLGLERSASDAARRLAMAKLTGEKISPWVSTYLPFCFKHANHLFLIRHQSPTIHTLYFCLERAVLLNSHYRRHLYQLVLYLH